MKNRKSQLQMTQNIAIIMIIIFLLMFGFSFYSKLRSNKLNQKSQEYSELDVVKASQIISNLPELSCSKSFFVESNCIDKLKIEAFDELNLTEDYYDYYRSLFGKSTVILKEVYPDNTSSYVIYNNTYGTENVSYSPIYVPINIYDAVDEVNNFGVLVVGKYIR